MSTIKISNNETIRLYRTTQKEPYWGRVENSVELHSSNSIYIALLICLTLIICITIYIYRRKSSIHKLINKPEIVGLSDEQIDDNRKLRKECSDLSSQIAIIESKFHNEHIRRGHLEKEMAKLYDTVTQKEKENEVLKMEIKKCNDRIYSIENKLKKAEYDNRQLEEKLLKIKYKL